MNEDDAVPTDATRDDDPQEPPRTREQRWRLVLGSAADDISSEFALVGDDVTRDGALERLYDSDGKRRGGLGGSAPKLARWLGDIRTYFPSSVVQLMQTDAIERLGLTHLLLEPEILESVQPDLDLIVTLMSLGAAIPESSKESARIVVRKVTDDLQARLGQQTVQAVTGALNRSARTRRPRMHDVDWPRTIAANLKNYLPDYQTVVPERLIGHSRASQRADKHIVLCIDQSGSMAESIVYSSVFGAVLASLKSVRTSLVVFDTEVVDLTDEMDDPVDVLFGVQLGGGTDINRAIAYCQSLIEAPTDTVFVLISDLYEGGIADEMLRRAKQVTDSGATMIALLALSDSGRPSYDVEHATALSALGVPAFACTPDLFPELMAAAINREDIGAWASGHDLNVTVDATPEADE